MNYASQQTCPRPAARRSAFTLIEMMVVVSIIVIVLASLVPVVGTLSNNNGIAGASNQVAAIIGNARADALYNRIPTGVMFYVDPVTLQTAVAEVQADQQAYPSTTGTIYSFNPSTGGSPTPVMAIELVNHYDPISDKFIYDRDVVLLGRGVGIALYNNQSTPSSAGNPSPDDRYVRLGLVLFNPDGTLANTTFGIQKTRQKLVNNTLRQPLNQLWLKLASSNPGSTYAYDIASTVIQPLMSAAGFVYYDTEKYLNQHTTSSGNSYNFLDLQYKLPSPTSGYQPKNFDKQEEEYWLDQNGVPNLISPFNGEVIKAK